jgi:hypothetical protein
MTFFIFHLPTFGFLIGISLATLISRYTSQVDLTKSEGFVSRVDSTDFRGFEEGRKKLLLGDSSVCPTFLLRYQDY